MYWFIGVLISLRIEHFKVFLNINLSKKIIVINLKKNILIN